MVSRLDSTINRSVTEVTQLQRPSSVEKTNNSQPQKGQQDRSSLKELSGKELEQAIEGLNRAFEPVERGLQFEVHDETNRVIVKVIDKTSEEVIREIPPEKIVNMLAHIRELIGVLIDEKA